MQVQIQAYLDNVFDVGTLLEDAETKNAALERVEELEENLGTVSEIAIWFKWEVPDWFQGEIYGGPWSVYALGLIWAWG